MSKNPSRRAQDTEEQITTMKIILAVSFILGIIASLLPQESIDGSPVPTRIFRGRSSLFHAFLICIMFSFSGSFCYLMIEKKLRVAKFCRFYSIISMAVALSILVYALILDGLNCVSSGNTTIAEQK